MNRPKPKILKIYHSKILINVDNTIKPPTLLSICTGMRGLEKGIARGIAALRGYRSHQRWQEQDYIKPAAYVEIESVVAQNLVAQMEQRVLDPTPVWTDLKTFPWSAFHGKICLFAGGYPCQPFSTAGKQHGVLDPRHLWPYIELGIRAVGPVGCFFENVSNHLNIGYREVRHSLESLGYQVKEGIFSAEEVGAPHLRKRIFILAVANSYCSEQSKRRGDLAKMLGLQEVKRQPELGSALSQQNWDIGEIRRWSGHTSKEGELANANIWRQQHRIASGVGGIGEQTPWPARPGKYQHPWESPRTIESRLGFTVDGYDFTEDLLRMAGNAVVEQQAELAFKTLIKKFL